jgi:NAD(P)-dependent dehydrogenase (short-subunit alcohol dehydrogenase family)
MNLTDKIALVTGSTTAIGVATGRNTPPHPGHDVVASDRIGRQ